MIKRTPLKRKSYSIKKVSEKQKVKNELKKEQVEKRHQMFLEIWDEREETDSAGNKFVRCFETGKRMSREFYRENTCVYHHILEKSDSKFPQYDLVKDNIVILHFDVHNQVHTNIDKTPKVKAKYQELLQKHLNNELWMQKNG